MRSTKKIEAKIKKLKKTVNKLEIALKKAYINDCKKPVRVALIIARNQVLDQIVLLHWVLGDKKSTKKK